MGIMVMLLEEKKKSEVNAFCDFFFFPKLHQVSLFGFNVHECGMNGWIWCYMYKQHRLIKTEVYNLLMVGPSLL